MDQGLVEILLFVLAITALTVLPFVLTIAGVMVLRWWMTRSRGVTTSDAEPEGQDGGPPGT